MFHLRPPTVEQIALPVRKKNSYSKDGHIFIHFSSHVSPWMECIIIILFLVLSGIIRETMVFHTKENGFGAPIMYNFCRRSGWCTLLKEENPERMLIRSFVHCAHVIPEMSIMTLYACDKKVWERTEYDLFQCTSAKIWCKNACGSGDWHTMSTKSGQHSQM